MHSFATLYDEDPTNPKVAYYYALSLAWVRFPSIPNFVDS